MTSGTIQLQPSGAFLLSPEEEELLVRRVKHAVRRSCPPYLAAQAEDIAQEVLLQLFRKLRRTEGNATFSSMYLLKAAHGITVDEIRRRSRRREQIGLEDEMQAHQNSRPDPEREAMARSLGREIRRCLDGIIASRRVAVTLHLLGCAVPEIADRLQCPLKSADNRVYRGMKDLRACLTAKGIEP